MQTVKKSISIIMILVILSIIPSQVFSANKTKYYPEKDNITKGIQLKFKGISWYVYPSKAKAIKAAKENNGSKYCTGVIKTGTSMIVRSVDDYILEIGENKFIIYGSTGSKYFERQEFTKNIKVKDKLKLKEGSKWTIYPTEKDAIKLNKNSKIEVLNGGKTVTVRKKIGNVLQIGENKFIYYGSNANQYFTIEKTTNDPEEKEIKVIMDSINKGNVIQYYTSYTSYSNLEDAKNRKNGIDTSFSKVIEKKYPNVNVLKLSDGRYVNLKDAINFSIGITSKIEDIEPGDLLETDQYVKVYADKNLKTVKSLDYLFRVEKVYESSKVIKTGDGYIEFKDNKMYNANICGNSICLDLKTGEFEFDTFLRYDDNTKTYTYEAGYDNYFNQLYYIHLLNKESKTVTFKSSNEKVATVSQNGLIRVKKLGKSTITITAKEGSKITTIKLNFIVNKEYKHET